jgi:hypothetical protein
MFLVLSGFFHYICHLVGITPLLVASAIFPMPCIIWFFVLTLQL